jgi:hypothetical protein
MTPEHKPEQWLTTSAGDPIAPIVVKDGKEYADFTDPRLADPEKMAEVKARLKLQRDNIKTSETADQDHCPACGEELGSATGVGKPKPGDVSVCAYCEALMVFNDDMTVRLMTEEEKRGLSTDGRAMLEIMRTVVQQRIRERK